MLQCSQLALENTLLKVGKDENPGSVQSSSPIICSLTPVKVRGETMPHSHQDSEGFFIIRFSYLRCPPAHFIFEFKITRSRGIWSTLAFPLGFIFKPPQVNWKVDHSLSFLICSDRSTPLLTENSLHSPAFTKSNISSNKCGEGKTIFALDNKAL